MLRHHQYIHIFAPVYIEQNAKPFHLRFHANILNAVTVKHTFQGTVSSLDVNELYLSGLV